MLNIELQDLLHEDVDQDIWWEDNNLYVATKTGTYKLLNAYITSIIYGNLDSSISTVGNTKVWETF